MYVRFWTSLSSISISVFKCLNNLFWGRERGIYVTPKTAIQTDKRKKITGRKLHGEKK